MARGSQEDFNLSNQFEWECRVLQPVAESGLSAPGDFLKARHGYPMSAENAVLRFVEEYRESQSGAATIGVVNSKQTEGYVVDANWTLMPDGVLSIGVRYKCSREDWHEKRTRGQEAGA